MENTNFDKYIKSVMIKYVIFAIFFIGLSFIGLLFNEWILPICVGICSVFGALVTLLLLFGHRDIENNVKGSYALFTFLRFICMAIGLVVVCLLIKFTMGEEVVKNRYLIAVVSALPYFIPSIAVILTRQV